MRAFAPILTAVLALAVAMPAAAGTVHAGEARDVSLTIYRDPNRGEGAVNRFWPGGYALVSETRTIHLPAGTSVIRFEGVAQGLLPESAIVTGLPNGVREKNRDARLISPAGLVDANLKRRVILRRTDRATGKVTEQDAIIQAGPDAGVILQTAEGYEALGCAGLPERMIYDGVPDDLSARPTLSVVTESDRETTVTVQLSYLAEGFDWSADYVAEHDPGDARKLSLFAWLTIANGGSESFADARLQVVAGQPNREAAGDGPERQSGALELRCWPMATTRSGSSEALVPPPPPPPPPPPAPMTQDIVVTAQRRAESLMAVPAVVAEQEDLGDLKLYRVPIPVTVAAQAQKQVALLSQPEADFDRIYTADVGDAADGFAPMALLLRSKNVKPRGLGLPLPAGAVVVYEPAAGRTIPVATSDLADRAVGDEVELAMGSSTDVQWALTRLSQNGLRQRWRVEISNARDVPAAVEIVIPYELERRVAGVTRGRGGWVWKTVVPAAGTARVEYGLKVQVIDRRESPSPRYR